MKTLIIALMCSCVFGHWLLAEDDSTTDFREVWSEIKYESKAKRAPSTAGLLSLFIPTGGFIYLNDWANTAFFLSMEISLYNYAVQYNNDTKGEEYNVPLKTLDTVRNIEVFSAYRRARIKYNNTGYKIPYEKKTIPELFVAPFLPSNFLKPTVFVPAIIAAALTNYEIDQMENDPRPLSDVKDVTAGGKLYNRQDGFNMYELLWGTVSLDAGVGEELLFRGFIQSEMTNRTTPTTGLLCSSLIFGILHLGNPGQSNNTTYAGFATLAGIYFGWLFIDNDYQLSQPIAAHFWWNFTVGTVAFLRDPLNNPLGVKVTFTF